MRQTVLIVCVLLCLAWMAVPRARSENETPVRIEFDPDAKRIDMLSGREVPAYEFARRGTFRFYSGRLDEPEDFVRYFHDGRRTAPLKNLRSMEKFKKSHSQWRLRFTTRGDSPQYIPRVYSLAVSFVPLRRGAMEEDGRVYLPLDDLRLIDWEHGSKTRN